MSSQNSIVIVNGTDRIFMDSVKYSLEKRGFVLDKDYRNGDVDIYEFCTKEDWEKINEKKWEKR